MQGDITHIAGNNPKKFWKRNHAVSFHEDISAKIFILAYIVNMLLFEILYSLEKIRTH